MQPYFKIFKKRGAAKQKGSLLAAFCRRENSHTLPY